MGIFNKKTLDYWFLSIAILVIAYRLLLCFSYKLELSVGEANNIWNAISVANGKIMYSNPENIPFEILQYTPYSQLPIILISTFLNKDYTNYYYIIVLGRILSLIYNVLTFVFLYKLMNSSLNIHSVIARWTSFFGFCILTHLSFSIRPDAMGVLFTILSLYFYSKAYFKINYKWIVLSSILFSICFYIKQDAFLIIFILGLMLLIRKEVKLFLIFTLTFCLSFSILSIINRIFFGEFFFNSILGGVNNGISFSRAKNVFERYITFYGFLFFTGLFCSFYIYKINKCFKYRLFLVSLFVFSFLLAFLSSLKNGSWINYYTLVNICSLLVISFLINLIYANGRQKETIFSLKSIVTVFIFYFLYQQIYHYTSPFMKYSESKQYHENIIKQFQSLKSRISNKNINLYTSNPELKLYFFKNIIFPNYEFYPVSSFSKNRYNKLPKQKQISLIILDQPYLYYLDGSPFSEFNIDKSQFKVLNNNSNFTILENGNNEILRN